MVRSIGTQYLYTQVHIPFDYLDSRGVQRLRSIICTRGIRFDSIRLRTGSDSIRFDSIIVSGKVERFDSERFAFDCRLLTIMKFIDKAMKGEGYLVQLRGLPVRQ